ncbi:FAD-binding oxidoreductase [Candidatus Aerophobetes bacterium]|uniref:FAD-binding oxidoreductase n=1 Tax=Aerophobetes bacterium TaxID=2030807 RepID=A0A662DCG9_UNCAE|nr:MAG: FAD-binding oxidoreductase [Candidatus Aerophobetes bacterium]
MSVRSAEVVVIGGGVIGTAITYYLARQGVDVALVERGDIASGTSSACDGFVMLQTKDPGLKLKMALESAQIFQNLSDELEWDIGYRKDGGMVIIETKQQLEAVLPRIEEQRKYGLKIELLDSQQTKQRQPCLGNHLIASTYSPMDAQVHPIKLTLGFAQAAEKHGAKLCLFTEVKNIRIRKNQINAVITDNGQIKTEVVVNAAGVMAPQVGKMVNLEIPIIPRRGQIVVTEQVPPLLKGILTSATYLAAKKVGKSSQSTNEDAKKLGVGLIVEQTEDGNLILGSTREFVGYNKRTSYQGIHAVIKGVTKVIPVLREVNVIRTFAGLRPATPDGLPILGEASHPKGFIIAAGHEGDGIALAPITGKLIGDLITKGEFPNRFAQLNLQRFSKN